MLEIVKNGLIICFVFGCGMFSQNVKGVRMAWPQEFSQATMIIGEKTRLPSYLNKEKKESLAKINTVTEEAPKSELMELITNNKQEVLACLDYLVSEYTKTISLPRFNVSLKHMIGFQIFFDKTKMPLSSEFDDLYRSRMTESGVSNTSTEDGTMPINTTVIQELINNWPEARKHLKIKPVIMLGLFFEYKIK